jgi:putative endonuclease
MKIYWVYLLSSKRNGTLYTGVTNDLLRRVYEHKHKLVDGFTKRYNLTQLVYAEEFNDINEATLRENCIKQWKRALKLKLIEEENPNWKDLYEDLT